MTQAPSCRLKYLAPQVLEKLPYQLVDRIYVGLEHIRSWSGEISLDESASPDGLVTLFESGDILFGKLRPYLAKVANPDFSGSCSTEVLVLRPKSNVSPRYLRYALVDRPFIDKVDASTYGAKMPRASWEFIGSQSILVPDRDTQTAIARYLDRETARIDALIASKTKLVDLLSEKEAAAITQAVTGGLDPSAPKASTGLDWLPEAPAHWKVRRLATLLRETAEPGEADLPVLSVSIHHGISDRELDDEERDRKVLHIEDRTSYKRVRPGYLAYNMMRAWQGAFGVATVDGLVSPAYVVARLSGAVHPAYLEYLLRTPLCVEEMRRASRGIASFRLRLYWEAFRQIRIPLPDLDEQRAIAEFVAATSVKIGRTKAAVIESIERLREYRSALITAAVGGEIAVSGHAAAPSVATADRGRLRVLVGAEIIDRHRATRKFGRVKLQKLLYMAEAHAGIDELSGTYLREAAGPLDRDLLDDAERGMAAAEFYRADAPGNGNGNGVTYVPLRRAGKHKTELSKALGARVRELARVIDLMRDFDTRIVEAITTLYAVWNDALIQGKAIDDAGVIGGVLSDWHPEKKEKFRDANLQHWLDWMRRNDLVPKGRGPKTVTGRLFP